jgi:glycosyltransferase involved in cell wall biosynthesis
MLIEGPFESDYSLAIVNRRLALALLRLGRSVHLHQRDNTANYVPSAKFLAEWPQLAPRFVDSTAKSEETIHSRYIYPPFTDGMIGIIRGVHCYGWEESAFPRQYADAFNRDLDVITVMSAYVHNVLVENGVKIPIEVVGLGVDHIIECPAEPLHCFERDTFHFVHVSSCFPRKGADALVEAYCREFRRNENVRLIIKTFPNPHNEVEATVAGSFSRNSNHAPIRLIFEGFSPGQMRSLLEQADCLVAPSRGEGFGLPVAEAMLLGTPVIATIHGGHSDLCSPEWCWPVEFRMERARTHLTEGQSFWAEPNVDALASRMREVYESDREAAQKRTTLAKRHVRENFTWAAAAQRHEEACSRVLEEKRGMYASAKPDHRFHIGFITTWNARCGIAEYTRYLSSSLASDCQYSIFANRIPTPVRPDESNVSRCWSASPADISESEIDELTDRICDAGSEVLSIQYNFGLLSANTLGGLVSRLGSRGIPVFVTLHGLADRGSERFLSALADAHGVIVHRAEDRDRLIQSGLKNVHLQAQGIYVAKDIQRTTPAGSDEGVFTISCFGFFLPPKGIYELLQAVSAAAFMNPVLRLKLINALYDLPESHAYAAGCISLLQALGLGERTLVCTDFLDDNAILRELADSDLVVLPYIHSTEASSAAIRLPLASLTPVLCSDLQLFREFADIVHFFPARDTLALANRLLELSMDPTLLRKFETRQRHYVERFAWPNVAHDFYRAIASSRPFHTQHII